MKSGYGAQLPAAGRFHRFSYYCYQLQGDRPSNQPTVRRTNPQTVRTLFVTFFFPGFPVREDPLQHGFGSDVQPSFSLFVGMANNILDSASGSEVDVSCFPSHSVQKAHFRALNF